MLQRLLNKVEGDFQNRKFIKSLSSQASAILKNQPMQMSQFKSLMESFMALIKDREALWTPSR